MIHVNKAALLLALFLVPARLHAASPEFQIDIKELERQKPAAPPQPEHKRPSAHAAKPGSREAAGKKRQAAKAPSEGERAGQGKYVRYTVKPGDNIFKILMGGFGLSNEQAERLIPEIVELNDIGNIKSLQTGRALLIPAAALKGHARAARAERPARHEEKGGAGKGREAEAPKAPAPPLEAPRAPEPAVETPKAPEAPAPAPAPKPAPGPGPLPKGATAPGSAPAPTPASVPVPVPPPAPAPNAAPAPIPVPASPAKAPAPLAEAVPAPTAVPAPPKAALPTLQEETTWICPVDRRDVGSMADSVLNALSASWTRNKIIHSGDGAATPFSIRVDRYFEYKGGRYILSIGENDPYNYTLIRILETAGYRVLMLGGKEDFKTVSEKLFKLVGIAASFGEYALQEGKRSSGFLLRQGDAAGRQVLLTDAPAPSGYKWVMPRGCGAK